jgi:DNA polymerase-3 subunit delta'
VKRVAATEPDQELEAPAPAVAPVLARARAPWLVPLADRLRRMQSQARVPHGLLLVGAPGGGQAELGLQLAGELLCRGQGAGRCGKCADCALFEAGTHPDFAWLRVAPGKKEIAIAQVRSLTEQLSLRSYRGGAKVALVDPAEAMNIHSFNALLKTLEEPADETYLVLATSRADRIPPTIASRCTRLRVPPAARAEALAWLAQQEARQGWDALLALANGAPFLAAEYAAAGLEDLDREMREAIAGAAGSAADLVARARDWADQAPAARLLWLESWLAGELKAAGLSSDAVNNNRLPWLRGPGHAMKIQSGYRLLDRLREARRLAGGSLNMQLLFEGLLVSIAAFLAEGTQKVQE